MRYSVQYVLRLSIPVRAIALVISAWGLSFHLEIVRLIPSARTICCAISARRPGFFIGAITRLQIRPGNTAITQQINNDGITCTIFLYLLIRSVKPKNPSTRAIRLEGPCFYLTK